MKRPLEGNESGNNNKVPRMGNKGSKNENNKQENMSEEKMEVVATGEGKIVLCVSLMSCLYAYLLLLY